MVWVTSPTERPTATSLGHSPPSFTLQSRRLEAVIMQGSDIGRRVLLGDEPIGNGSTSDCDLGGTDPTVSLRLPMMARREGGTSLTDLDSKNGSFFADQRFDHVVIQTGDGFCTGSTHLRIIPCEEVIDPEPMDKERYGELIGGAPAM